MSILFAYILANSLSSYHPHPLLKIQPTPPAHVSSFPLRPNLSPILPVRKDAASTLLAIDSILQENDAVLRLLHGLSNDAVFLMELSNGALKLQAHGVLARVGAAVVGVLEAVERRLLLPHRLVHLEKLLLQLRVLVLRGYELGPELVDGQVRHCVLRREGLG